MYNISNNISDVGTAFIILQNNVGSTIPGILIFEFFILLGISAMVMYKRASPGESFDPMPSIMLASWVTTFTGAILSMVTSAELPSTELVATMTLLIAGSLLVTLLYFLNIKTNN